MKKTSGEAQVMPVSEAWLANRAVKPAMKTAVFSPCSRGRRQLLRTGGQACGENCSRGSSLGYGRKPRRTGQVGENRSHEARPYKPAAEAQCANL